jgi:hypothetical protein
MIIILSFLSAVLSLVHPLHVSVTEITYDEKEKELEIISRIFIDDLEAAIQNEKKFAINMVESEKTIVDRVVGEYLQNHFKVSLNGQAQKIVYLGHEIENEALLCYIQVKNVKRWNTIEVLNTVITELHEDQSNLVHVTVREKIKSLRLMKDNPVGKLTFE